MADPFCDNDDEDEFCPDDFDMDEEFKLLELIHKTKYHYKSPNSTLCALSCNTHPIRLLD